MGGDQRAGARPHGGVIKATLIASGALTVMAGAIVAPAAPAISAAFAMEPHAQLLSRLVVTAHAAAIMLLSPLLGGISDRFGPRRCLIAGILAFAIGGSSGVYLPGLLAILGGRLVLGAGMALIMTSGMALIGSLFTGAARQHMISQQAAVTAFGGMFFLAASGALASVDWHLVFLVYLAGIPLLAPVLLYLPDVKKPVPAAGSGPVVAGAGHRGWLVMPLSLALLGQVVFYMMPTQLPFLLGEKLQIGARGSGVVLGVMAGSMAVSSLAAGRLAARMPRTWMAAGSFVAIALGYLMLSAANTMPLMILSVAVAATGMGSLTPNISGWIQAGSPDHQRGRHAGFQTTAIFAGQFSSPLFSQPLVQRVGLAHSFATVAGLAVVVAVIVLVAARRQRPEL